MYHFCISVNNIINKIMKLSFQTFLGTMKIKFYFYNFIPSIGYQATLFHHQTGIQQEYNRNTTGIHHPTGSKPNSCLQGLRSCARFIYTLAPNSGVLQYLFKCVAS
jgi:hypothetical protein